MNITDDVLARARRLEPAAVESLLASAYPAVCRMAHALTGSEPAAKAVIDGVMGRSVNLLPRWREGGTPENWFYHHTVLTARHAAHPPHDPHHDPLVRCAPEPAATNPRYVAFVRALRNLP